MPKICHQFPTLFDNTTNNPSELIFCDEDTIPLVKANVNLFNSQTYRGPISLFRGLPRYHRGKGIGDFFWDLIRRILPIALKVAKSALSAMSDAQEQGGIFQGYSQDGTAHGK